MDLTKISSDTVPKLPREALEALIAALSGPKSLRYRVESRSKSRAGTSYTVDHIGTDFLCSCPGFEYRGTCSHARDVKGAVTSNRPLPAGITTIAD